MVSSVENYFLSSTAASGIGFISPGASTSAISFSGSIFSAASLSFPRWKQKTFSTAINGVRTRPILSGVGDEGL